MFLGEYEYTIDQKGRVAVPAKFRDAFREGLVLSRGFDRCLIVYPMAEWVKMAEKLASPPSARSKFRRLSRTAFSTAYNLDLDRQGRIVLPLSLREYAGITDSAIIAGIHNYLEIWSREAWAAEKSLMDEQAWHLVEAIEAKP